MSAGWVAATVRSRALLRRAPGPIVAGELIDAASWSDARAAIAETAYGAELPAGADPDVARRVVAAAAVWQLRVLAGWLPPGGAGLVRVAVAPFEIANIGRHLAHLEGAAPIEPIELGTLGTAWPNIASCSSAAEVRSLLRRSAWGDPGGSTRPEIELGLRAAWAHRVRRVTTIGRPWAVGALAVLAARERFAFDRRIAWRTQREIERVLGARWPDATTIDSFVEAIPREARWPFAGVAGASDLWRTELAVLGRIETDATEAARGAGHGPDIVAAVIALLLVDVWRSIAAIEAVGCAAVGREVLDVVAQ